MKIRSFLLAAVASTSLLASTAAFAGDEYVTLRAGLFDIDDVYEAGHIGLEYRGPHYYKGLGPIAGLEANEDGGFFGYAGLDWDFMLGQHWVITPSFAIAAYEEGDSRDLGGTLEFRSGLEIDYQMANQHRAGLSLHHISNAGIYDSNPGTEVVMFNYSIPVNWFE
ncbi:MAG: acyloxyacyl hydrolase [Rickettsiales bacterium]